MPYEVIKLTRYFCHCTWVQLVGQFSLWHNCNYVLIGNS